MDLDAVVVDVAGVGRLGTPVPPAQARKLIALAAPAPFGRGEETLHDESVRDTWQVPTDLVTVDFGDHLGELLEAARDMLGMPEGSSLSMDLHSLLVYEKGQFFLPHQDSEKDDTMVGTVVVALPSRHTGGELVIHEGERDAAYRGSPSETSAVAFFADQVHEVRPVRSGYRAALTYNLLVTAQPDPAPVEDEVGQATQLLRRYFATPVAARWSGDATEPPLRYAYLLDHQYTQRGLGWSRLKGDDLERAGVLRAAAERVGCEVILALTDIHEVWDADAGDWRRGWREDSDEVELGNLIESEVVLTHWLAPGDRSATPVSLALDAREVGAATPTASLAPYDSQYEGYMGNYGNTVDRWYHRAAVVVWPAHLAFANRAESSPAWALADLAERISRGRVDSISADVASVASLWPAAVRSGGAKDELLRAALGVASAVDEAEAALLLGPFVLTELTPDHVPGLRALAGRHGASWVVAQVDRWHSGRRGGRLEADSAEWMTTLPDLCAGLASLPDVAEQVLSLVWSGLGARVAASATSDRTRYAVAALTSLADPVGLLLRASAVAGVPSVTERVVSACTSRPAMLPLVVALVRAAAAWPDDVRQAARVKDLAWYAVAQLSKELSTPPRSADDWSMKPPPGCDCPNCRLLAEFLTDPALRVREWPLAQHGRDHLHNRVTGADLPLTEVTRKTGRPYTLVLTKSQALFDREDARRQEAEAEASALADLLAAWT